LFFGRVARLRVFETWGSTEFESRVENAVDDGVLPGEMMLLARLTPCSFTPRTWEDSKAGKIAGNESLGRRTGPQRLLRSLRG